jgi:hypothetical protein
LCHVVVKYKRDVSLANVFKVQLPHISIYEDSFK